MRVQATEPVFGAAIGEVELRTHPATQCVGEDCCVHNPSDHPLKDAPMNWRSDRGLMERICEHGIGHPDPDDISFKARTMGEKYAYYEAIHGCDGCCNG